MVMAADRVELHQKLRHIKSSTVNFFVYNSDVVFTWIIIIIIFKLFTAGCFSFLIIYSTSHQWASIVILNSETKLQLALSFFFVSLNLIN